VKTIKPQKLGILTRCFEWRRRFSFAVSVFMYVPLAGEADLYSEASMWQFAAMELGKDAALDAAVPKEKAEFLVTGYACMPGGEPRSGCPVRVRLGRREKRLHVYGDRYWKGTFPSDPAPFTRMPLDWAHAFGGEGYDKNPLGKGFRPVTVNNVLIHWLPNIQHPAERVTSPDQRLEPAGFCPIDITWPQRFSKAGTYDDPWLKEDFPAFARDIDWTIFNLASPDQWFDEPLRGDESYLCENMHPSKPLLEGRLHGMAARCFINRRTKEGERFEEISTRLLTVWLFPHAERAILIYQGSCEVADEDAADVLQVIIGAERLAEPKPIEHYRAVLGKRLDKEKGSFYALQDSDLLPSGLGRADDSMSADRAMLEGEDLLRKRARERYVREIEKARAVVASHGLDPDLHAPRLPPPEEPLPDLEDLPAYAEKAFAEAEARKEASERESAKSLDEAEKLFLSLGMDFNQVRSEIAERPKGPPAFRAQAQIDALRALVLMLKEQGIAAAELEGYLSDQAFCNRLFEGEREFKKAYRFTAHLQDAAPPMAAEPARSVRPAIEAAYAGGESFAGADLTGADLSGMDLQGANFEDAFLESADFTGANLTGCNFQRAVLAHALLKDARLVDANLEGANLGAARLIGTKVSGANLSEAILAKADLTGAGFKGARLQGADCSGAVFHDTDFSEVHASQLNFLESDLRGLKLTGSQMEKCIFLRVDVTGVDFSGASLNASVFLETKGKASLFRSTDLTNVRFVQGCDFEAADFTGACLDKANLRGSRLSGCDFTRARLDDADLSECDLRSAKLYRAVARKTRFDKADLSNAIMTSVNAMNASLQRANICGTDLRGANLFQVDLARVHADGRTNLTGALTKKVRLYPRKVQGAM
jgi:uncharacterized protein YjbI with pentapeptide repeats